MDNQKTATTPSGDATDEDSSLIHKNQQPFAMALLACCLVLMAWFVIDQRIRRGRVIDIDDAGKIAWEMKVNVNEADVSELAALPGVGPVLAQAIVDHRDPKNPYRTPEDLLRVPGIGETKLGQLSGFLLFMVDSGVSDHPATVD